jgi:peptidoglycan/LPS O-acetylase OafA/YrhL
LGADGSGPESPPPVPAKPRHFPCFDGLRAIAATAILLDHAAWAAGYTSQNPGVGRYFSRFDVAVSIFFAVSGFLLYRPFVASQMSGRPRPSATKFWIRRLLRIVPAYWFALTILTYGFHVIAVGRGWQGFVADYSFLQIYFPTQSFTGITQAWTLCTEMSFYLFLPFYAMVLAFHRRSSRRPRSPERQLVRELIGVLVLIVGSNVWRWWALNLPFVKVLPGGKLVAVCYPHCATQPPMQGLYSNWLMSYLDTFGLGMLLAVLSAYIVQRGFETAWLRHRLMPYVSWGIAGGLFVAVSHLNITLGPLYFATPIVNLERQGLEGLVAFFMLVPAVFGPQDRSLIRKFLTSWPMASLGLISYGMYLWHLNMINLFMDWAGFTEMHVPFWQLVLPVLGLAIAWGTISYFVIERPVLRYKDRIGWWGSARTARAAASKPAPVALDGGPTGGD